MNKHNNYNNKIFYSCETKRRGMLHKNNMLGFPYYKVLKGTCKTLKHQSQTN